jgi:2-polyprenyl-3-methyl-5-hydroxy-6-metoxy-1,4-benzoquinol methylase
MSNKHSCPLCHGGEIDRLETIALQDLRKAYKKLCGHDITDQYKTDIDKLQCRNCSLIFFNPLIPGNEAFYNSLQYKPWYYSDDKAEFQYAATLIKPEHQVLEVGSGKGAFAQKIKCAKYTGLDFSVVAKELAAKRGVEILNVPVQEHAKTNAEMYDVACSFQVMEHVDDVYGVVKAQVDCLKPGGMLIIAVPAENSYLNEAFNLSLNLPPHHMSRWSNNTFEKLAEVMNIKLEKLHHLPLQEMHYHDYAFNLSYRAMRNATGLKYKSIDYSLHSRFNHAVSLVLSKILKNGFYKENLPKGHTIIGIFTK